MTIMKTIAVILALTFAFTAAVPTIVVPTDQAMAYTTVITHGDQAVGGCGGQGC